jgi:hypothetical protein
VSRPSAFLGHAAEEGGARRRNTNVAQNPACPGRHAGVECLPPETLQSNEGMQFIGALKIILVEAAAARIERHPQGGVSRFFAVDSPR